MSPTQQRSRDSSMSLSQLPWDELKAYAGNLGVAFNRDAGQGEILRLIRQRQEILLDLDRQALLDICIWARRPVRQSAGKEELAKEIATINKMRFEGLSDPGLYALGKLNQLPVSPTDDRDQMIRLLKKSEPFGKYVQRKRRRLMASLINKLIAPAPAEAERDQADYQFLPEDERSLKQTIEEDGVVGGITRKIKGVADDYVREKLDEIERRIDRKLDEIDGRLAEWRDREIHNRLRIIKITLIASIIVALLSLGYDYVRRLDDSADAETEAVTPTQLE